jgi:hypothetical protein
MIMTDLVIVLPKSIIPAFGPLPKVYVGKVVLCNFRPSSEPLTASPSSLRPTESSTLMAAQHVPESC